MNRVYLILICSLTLCCHPATGEERLKLNKTTILGSGELPKVTFVVPWRDAPSAIPELKPSPTASPVITPLDHELFQLQLEYLRQLNQPKGGASAR